MKCFVKCFCEKALWEVLYGRVNKQQKYPLERAVR